MVDPVTTIGVAVGGALASKDVLNKLLGPTADYLGEGGRDLVKNSVRNLNRVFTVAYEKLKGAIAEDGQVNARVLKSVWDEGRFAEDAFSAEYFGGLLASSRTKDGQDDSAVPFLAQVKSLSSAQLRLHFVVYSLVASAPYCRKHIGSGRSVDQLEVFLPAEQLAKAMGQCGGIDEGPLYLALSGLTYHRLLGTHYSFSINGLRRGRELWSLKEEGVRISPSDEGVALFLKALGLRGIDTSAISTVVAESFLSQAVAEGVYLPEDTKFYQHSRLNPEDAAENAAEGVRTQLDDEIEDVRTFAEEGFSGLKRDLAALRKFVAKGDDDTPSEA